MNTPTKLVAVLGFSSLFLLGSCERVLTDLDHGIADMDRLSLTAQELSDTLKRIKDGLNNREYQKQLEETISFASKELVNAPEQLFDFARNRVKEDLRAMKAVLLGGPPPARTPMLCGAVVPQVDFRDDQRSTVKLNGWNLDVPLKAPSEYWVEVRNQKPELTRLVPSQFVSYPGPYWMTIDVSKTGFPLQHGDCQILLWKGREAATLSIINSEPPTCGKLALITRQGKGKHDHYSISIRIDTPTQVLVQDVVVLAGGEIPSGKETTLYDGPLLQSLQANDQITVHISTRHTHGGHQFDGDHGGDMLVRFYTEHGHKEVLPKPFFITHRGDVEVSEAVHVPFTVPSLL